MTTAIVPLGTYRDVEIQARPDDGYVNATTMCQATGKLWANYSQNGHAKDFAAALAEQIGIPISDLVISVKGQGTWVHRRIALHLAQWCSAEFAVWVSGKLEELLTTGHASIIREHAEAKMDRWIGMVSECLCGFTAKQEETIKTLHFVREEVGNLSDRVGHLERSRRKGISSATRRKHAKFIALHYQGKCPCCQKIPIVTADGGELSNCQGDHYEARNKPQLELTWLVCRECNRKLLDGEFHTEARPFFNAYQAFLKRWIEEDENPLFHGLVPCEVT